MRRTIKMPCGTSIRLVGADTEGVALELTKLSGVIAWSEDEEVVVMPRRLAAYIEARSLPYLIRFARAALEELKRERHARRRKRI